jgi:molybdopterin/thiamine biosynthesis adenylyltransferase
MSLTDDQLDRYARQIILKEIGGAGQQRLLASHVLVIGAGGIGCPAIQYLAAAGVGRLTIVDDDQVELSNLHRQILFTDHDLGQDKAALAARRSMALNGDVLAEAKRLRIGPANAAELLTGVNVVLDGCDNFPTRLAVADAALRARVPLVSAAVGGFEGQLATYRGWEPAQPCYACLVGNDPERPGTSCADEGVLGALAGVMGSLAAMEVVRQLSGLGENITGRLLRIEALSLRFRTTIVPKDPGCPTCGG